MEIDKLDFEPLISFNQAGNQIQRCATNYKGIQIMWETFFPYSFLEDPVDTFMVDKIVPVNTKLTNGFVNGNYYTDEGYGYPVFKTLKDAVNWVDENNSNFQKIML